jgi:NADPH-dependent curcumin reductase
VPVGAVMRSFGAGQVVESRSPRYQPGDIITGLTGWQEWAVLTEQDVQRKVDPSLAPISTSLGVLGITGLVLSVGCDRGCS